MTEKHLAATEQAAPGKRRTTKRGVALATVEGQRFLTFKDVAAITSFHVVTLYRKVAAGEFPQPLRLSVNRVGFRESDVRAWMEGRNAAKPRPKPRIRSNQLRQVGAGEAA